ncbi:MAG: hypothetical protein ACR2KZ_06515, partial [Segetibacter sp.]
MLPIIKLPAGITTISGQSGQSLNVCPALYDDVFLTCAKVGIEKSADKKISMMDVKSFEIIKYNFECYF